MIIARLNSGLGNQLFQYAAAKALAERHRTGLKLDLSWFQAHSYRKYQLHHFNISATPATREELLRYNRNSRWLLQKDLWRAAGMKNRYLYYKEQRFDFDPEVLRCGPDTLIDGYWQSERYFKDIAPVIMREFAGVTPLSEKSCEIKTRIMHTESVSVHIRRGDYLISGTGEKRIHGPLENSYYDEAIACIEEKTRQPHLFIFSDDITWAKEHLHFRLPASYVGHNDECTGFEDLILMSLCRQNIIANSTFSWWGAWLNRNPAIIVVSPAMWFHDVEMNSRTGDLIPRQWIRM